MSPPRGPRTTPASAISGIAAPVDWPPWAFKATIGLSLLTIVGALLLPARGDEVLIYSPPIAESIRVWPRTNTWNVQYGISPIYLWLAGGVGHLLHLSAHLAGRLVSITGWIGAAFACFSRRRLVRPVALLALLNPIVLSYAMRAHPYTLAIGVLWAGWVFSRGRPLVWAIASFIAANLQNFMLPAVGLGALVLCMRDNDRPGDRDGRSSITKSNGNNWIGRLALPLAIGAAGVLGMVASWVLYGGMFPKGFQSNAFYQSYRTFRAFAPGYIPMVAGLGGLLIFIFGEGRMRWRAAGLWGTAGVAVAAFTVARQPPIGPLFNTAAAGGRGVVALLGVLVGGMSMGLARRQQGALETVAALAALALLLLTIPYLYERYVWFGIVPIVMVWSTLQKIPRPRAIHAWYSVAALAGALVYLRYGSL